MESDRVGRGGSSHRQAKGFAGRVGSWSVRHPWLAIGLWIVFVVAAVVGGNRFSVEQLSASQSQAGESGKAAAILDRHALGIHAGENVLVQSRTLDARSPAFRAAVGDVEQRLKGVPGVIDLRSPYDSGAIAPNGRSALVSFSLAGEPQDAPDKIKPALAATAAAQAAHPGLTIVEAGDASFGKTMNDTQGKDFQKAETLSLPITLLILILAFGGLLMAGVPVLLAMSAVVATGGLVRIASHLLPMTDTTSSVILLIGLAVGVDYSLFMIARARQERAAGATREQAITIATATSGRAVLISGLTVVAAMSGMFLTGNELFGGIALGTMMVVAVAMVGSLTVLPALLAPKGPGIFGRLPGAAAIARAARAGGRVVRSVVRTVTWPVRAPFGLLAAAVRRVKGERTVWDRILTPVLRHPAIATLGGVAVLVALALPALGLTLGFAPNTYGLDKNLPVLKADQAIRAAFPGSPSPALVVIEATDVTSPAAKAAIAGFERAALASGQARSPITIQVAPDHRAAQLQVPIAGDGHDAAAVHATSVLRGDVVPATLGSDRAIEHAYVTGEAGGTHDFTQLMHDRAPLVIGFVLLLSFLLLLVTFRSIVVPIKAITLNVLSVGAAYGILVAVFQHGVGASWLGVKPQGEVESWLPIFLFVVLFGLSMDYHVFILSRVRELWATGLRTQDAVAEGIRSTAGVVTSAAAVMVAVFAIFATLSDMASKQLGIGLATAILLDATIVRGVLLPATMTLLGERNWYLPRPLNWLPRIDHGSTRQEPATVR